MRTRPRPHCVRWGPSSPRKKGNNSPPQFSAHVRCGQTTGWIKWIKMKLSMEVGLSPGHIVLHGDLDPPPPKGHSPQFSAHVCCGQAAGWIKMPLGRDVSLGLGPGHILLRGDPAPLPQMGIAPQFTADVCCGQTAGWIKIPLGREV